VKQAQKTKIKEEKVISTSHATSSFLKLLWYLKAVFCIRMGFNADPAFSVNADPDPGF